MRNVIPNHELSKLIADFSNTLIKSPFLFLIIVIIIYSILNKEKRKSVNEEIVKLIKALTGRE